ncbi:MAG: hypothetical protein NT086_19835 [Proteobacteria bacterium]|nr:hypothetical protein [Pseudomonadota bacterium]
MFQLAAITTFWRELKFTEQVLKNEEKEFAFKLQFKRLPTEELERRTGVEGKETMQEFLPDVVTDWDGVAGEDGQPLPFTPDNFKSLLQVAGIAPLAFSTYIRESAVLRAKN